MERFLVVSAQCVFSTHLFLHFHLLLHFLLFISLFN
uniref:Uncharacterized protein n=1 Tax=Arundo donax TaxID=35708 RepID=A0A0A9H7T5_ARUDO